MHKQIHLADLIVLTPQGLNDNILLMNVHVGYHAHQQYLRFYSTILTDSSIMTLLRQKELNLISVILKPLS